MKNKYFNKISNRFVRYRLYENPKFYRPSSKPFISGDSFRKISNHIFDETMTLNVNKVKKNDIVFVKGDLLKIFFENYHPFIKSKYILISHNSDINVDDSFKKYLDQNIIHWFCSNLDDDISNDITPIPIGLENMRYRKNGNIKYFLKALKFNEEQSGVLSSFNENTNLKKRIDVKQISQNSQYIDTKKFSNSIEYLNNLKKYKFNICPEGNGLDTHRVWESLVFGVTPIVLNNKTNLNFFKLGVPLLIFDSWERLSDLNLDDIEKLNLVNRNKDYKIFASHDFWVNLVFSKKLI